VIKIVGSIQIRWQCLAVRTEKNIYGVALLLKEPTYILRIKLY